ncbi:MAG: DUF924 family protein [Kiloniellaceae bacterium]
MARIGEILDFWFGPGMAGKWFVEDADFDREVRAKLAAAYERAAAGALDRWRDSAGGCVALCILLDQVPRNVFRGQPRAYASDAKALRVTHNALARGFDRELPQVRRLFLYLPLEHAEAPEEQALSVRLIVRLDENPDWLAHALWHRDTVARFGRFPHRNAVLGRSTTPEEAAFLALPDSRF